MARKMYGLLAEFSDADELLLAARSTRDAGYQKIDAFAPFPVHGLHEAIGMKGTKLPYLVLIGGLLGVLLGYTMQFYTSVVAYPMDIGGKPVHSWPAFIPVTFELGILFASFTAVFGMFLLNGFPKPYHPVFNVPQFAAASRNRFFLCVESKDPRFDRQKTEAFLRKFSCEGVYEIDA